MNLNGQYGNSLLDANARANLRGSGQWNPPPTMVQSTPRGNGYNEAYNLYTHQGGKEPPLPLAPLPTFASQTDQWNSEKFVVGTTQFHPQKPQSWTVPNVDGVGDKYQEWAQQATNMTPNTLMNFFFSKTNVDYLQNRVISEAKNIRGVTIARQSDDDLLIIMLRYYLSALSGWLPQEHEPNRPHPRGEAPCSLKEKLSRLNKSTIEEAVKQVLSGIDMYREYYKQASSLPLPLSRPVLTTMKGSRVLQQNVGFDSGHAQTKAIDSYNMRDTII